MKKSIFNSKLNSIKEYFMRGSSYFTMEMPEYFDFDKMLVEIDKTLPKDFNSIFNSKLKPGIVTMRVVQYFMKKIHYCNGGN